MRRKARIDANGCALTAEMFKGFLEQLEREPPKQYCGLCGEEYDECDWWRHMVGANIPHFPRGKHK